MPYRIRNFPQQYLDAVLKAARTMLPFHLAVLAYSLAVLGFSWHLGRMDALAYGQYIDRFGPVYLIAMPLIMLCGMIVLLIVRTHDWPARRLAVARTLAPDPVGRFVSGLIALASFIIFMGSFTTFKNLMPDLMGGFLFDRVQADIDRILHFGHDPGPVLIQVFDAPFVRRAIEWNYSVLWSLLGFLPIYFIAVSASADRLRLRYFMTIFAVWSVLGSLLACLFLSAGPAFYGHVTGDVSRFAPLLAFLADTTSGGASAARFQAYLWDNFISGTPALGTGISAFPSVHVGLAMMHALFLRELSRTAGLIGFGYVAVVTMSSIYLGWHYAIDGYVSIIVVAVLYAVLKRLFRSSAARESLTPHSIPAKA